jgi:antitoxin HicB
LLLEPQPEGGYTITCPLIPGLITEVDTLDQVQPRVADALAALIEGYQALGKAMPPALRALVAQVDMPL